MNVGFFTDFPQTVAGRGRDAIGRAWPQGSPTSGAFRGVFGLMANRRHDLPAIKQNHETCVEKSEAGMPMIVRKLPARKATRLPRPAQGADPVETPEKAA